MKRGLWAVAALGLLTLFAPDCPIFAQTSPNQADMARELLRTRPVSRVPRVIDDTVTVTLSGNRHPLARPEYDAGAVAPDTPMDRMILVLQPDATQQAALDALANAQQDPESSLYHQWLTPEQFGASFGIAQSDLVRISSWLGRHGFAVEEVAAGGRQIVFSGTAAQVAAAFHTEIHGYMVGGELMYANAGDPQIPEALAGVVGGVVSLHNFAIAPSHRSARPLSRFDPLFTSGSSHYLAPADFAAIYDVAALYSKSIDGTGQSIAVAGRTNIKLSDVQTFRSQLGLGASNATVVLNGSDPGVVSQDEEVEADLDVQWSGAVAKNASVKLVVSASTNSSDGIALSSQYIVSHDVAPVVSLSFGSCEVAIGNSGNLFWNGLWQQAAVQGMTVAVSSGDAGAAGCDDPSETTAAQKAGVNGLCSSPYSTCVGGTEFADTSNPGTYWSSTNASGTDASAKGYIPETSWNESASVAGGSDLWASGGGQSTVYPKPGWQSGPGVPSTGLRAVPDVSLSAASHDAYMVMVEGQFYAVGGTSAAAPSFAGMMSLNVQNTRAPQGNANPILYSLATLQSKGGAAVFHDITTGTNTVPGVNGFNAGVGYDEVTGLGSVDAGTLVSHWGDATTVTPGFQLVPSSAPVAVTVGASNSTSIGVTVSGGFNAPVTLTLGTLPQGLTATLSAATLAAPGSGTVTLKINASASLAAGSYKIAVGATGGNLSQSTSIAVSVAPNCTYAINPSSAAPVAAAGSYSVAVTAPTGCAWTAATGTSWIAVLSNASGSGNGTVGYSVAANSATAARAGTLTVAGLTLTVTQAAAPFAVNSTSASYAASGGRGTIAVSAASATATWTATSGASWIAITQGGSGKGGGTVSYSVAANTTTAARSGTIALAGLTFTVTQAASAPVYSLTPASASYPATGGSGSIGVTVTPSSTSWTAASSVAWIAITSNATASGAKTVGYSVAANTGAPRTGNITIGGVTFAVSQAGTAPCTYSLALGTTAPISGGVSDSVTITTAPGCSWTAVSNASWLTVTSGASGTGSGKVTFNIASNTTKSARSGSIAVAGYTITVQEAAASTANLGPVIKLP